ncbi:MAG: restriction endonuclease subunit S [Desulfobacula sp.]|nr:restriction endonuclease subunit S [Desulfobacula sp.]
MHFLDCDRINLPSIKKEFLKNYPILKDGDVNVVDASEDYEGVGKSVEVINLKNRKVISGLHTFLLRDKKETIAKGFKGYIHSNKLVKKQMDTLATGLKVYGVSKTNLKLIKIPLPPTKAEQTAIATALNDADALITQLEKLIAKKRAIKQGAMQELLNGKKRLDGYNNEWVTKPFSDVCWFQEGPGLRNWQFTKSGMKVINVTNLENGYLNLDRTDRHISIEEFSRMYQHFAIDENDIVVASSGNSYAKVAVVRKQDLPLVMNTSVIRFKPLKKINYNFLLAFLKSCLFKDQIDLLITGGAQPNFGPAHLKRIFINIPHTIEEQKDVADILTNIDLEIFGLEKKLEKYKMLKQGMMQNLLTGRIRLV